jgi:hypothetical protein
VPALAAVHCPCTSPLHPPTELDEALLLLVAPKSCIGVQHYIPNCAAGEWLCWPCKLYEEQQLAAGKAQAEIRKPRWEATASSPTRCRRVAGVRVGLLSEG